MYKLYLRPGPIPDNRWPIQNELNSIFIVFLSHIALFGHFFLSYWSVAYILWFSILYFYRFFNVCVSCNFLGF